MSRALVTIATGRYSRIRSTPHGVCGRSTLCRQVFRPDGRQSTFVRPGSRGGGPPGRVSTVRQFALAFPDTLALLEHASVPRTVRVRDQSPCVLRRGHAASRRLLGPVRWETACRAAPGLHWDKPASSFPHCGAVESAAYVAPQDRSAYVCGGVQGGATSSYVAAMVDCSGAILRDYRERIDRRMARRKPLEQVGGGELAPRVPSRPGILLARELERATRP